MNSKLKDFSGLVEFKYITENLVTGLTSVNVYASHYRNGVLHREDGPAVFLDGRPLEWWVNGYQYSEEEYGHWLKKKALKEKLIAQLDARAKEKVKKI